MKIGVLRGQEKSFPEALIDRINQKSQQQKLGITAEFALLDGVRMAEPSGYRVIVDRISHEIPFFRAYLKNAMLSGTEVINNPFWWSADEKFLIILWRPRSAFRCRARAAAAFRASS
jgi:hypothetical protein